MEQRKPLIYCLERAECYGNRQQAEQNIYPLPECGLALIRVVGPQLRTPTIILLGPYVTLETAEGRMTTASPETSEHPSSKT